MTRIIRDPQGDEIQNVNDAIAQLREMGILRGKGSVNTARFDALRKAVKDLFQVPWTSITPPMERLLYSCAAIQQPKNMVAIGIFCGNTLIWNAGAAVGPGKCFDAQSIVGVEIDKNSCDIAKSNLDKLGVNGAIDLRCEDGHETIRNFPGKIDYLYLDANAGNIEGPSHGKRIYLTLLELAYSKLAEGALILAHDTAIPAFQDETGHAHDYIKYVRDKSHFTASASVEIEQWGIELTVL